MRTFFARLYETMRYHLSRHFTQKEDHYDSSIAYGDIGGTVPKF